MILFPRASGRLPFRVFAFLLLCALAPITARGQAEHVETGHPVYDFLNRLHVRQVIDGFSRTVLPLERKQVTQYLREAGARSEQMSVGEREVLARYADEFVAEADGTQRAVVLLVALEGLTYDEARVKHPAGYAAFEGRNADYDFENGESLRAMFERVTGKLQAIAAAHPGRNVVVVLHGGVLDIINRFVRGNSLETPRDFLIPNAGINWISMAGEAWHLDTWGETGHLEPGALDELPS